MSYAKNTSNKSLAKFNKDIGILASHEYSTTPEDILEKIEYDVKGPNIEVRNQIEEIFFNNVYEYISETFNGVLVNDVSNTNIYLQQNLGMELTKLQATLKKLINQINLSRENTFESQYAMQMNYNNAKIIQYTILAVVLIFIMLNIGSQKYLPYNWMYVLIGLIVFFYLVLLYFFIMQNQRRHLDDWNKINFSMKP